MVRKARTSSSRALDSNLRQPTPNPPLRQLPEQELTWLPEQELTCDPRAWARLALPSRGSPQDEDSDDCIQRGRNKG